MSIERIVVGVDGGEGGARALRWAADLAAPIGAEVIVVHAIRPEVAVSWATEMGGVATPLLSGDEWKTWRDAQERRIERRSAPLLRAAEVPYRILVVDGHPAAVIMGMAGAENADLIVVGRRGRGGLAELVLGSVSHQLTHHARRPVVVVPPRRDAPALHIDHRRMDARRHSRVPRAAPAGTERR